jgi:hypothetical protein
MTLVVHEAEARIIRVALDGSGADGMSWETAYNTVSAGIANSASGGAIWIKSATYNESINLKTGVSLYGGFAGTEADDEFSLRNWKNNVTAIDGTGRGHSVVRCNSVNQVTMDGLSIVKGMPTVDSEAGGVTLVSSQVIIRNCTIGWNQSLDESYYAGGIGSLYSNLVCEYSSIIENRGGGGIGSAQGSLVLRSCVLDSNRNRFNLALGGGLSFQSGSGYLETCLILRNSVLGGGSSGDSAGGGVYSGGGVLYLTNCTLAENTADYVQEGNGFGIYCGNRLSGQPSSAALKNCIVSAAKSPISGGLFTISHSDIYPNPLVNGDGNLNVDPHFIGGDPFNYHLSSDSPCIDSGTKTELLVTDLDGNSRPLDVPGVGIDGPNAFDMGAYEYPGPFSNSHSDINKDGKVDAEDLLLLQEDWQKGE